MTNKKRKGKVVKITDLRKLPMAKRGKPTTGQSAEERQLPYSKLNGDETSIIRMLNNRGGPRVPRLIEFLADGLEGDDAKLVARNAMRRVVSCGWAERVGRGLYRISEKGRKRLERL